MKWSILAFLSLMSFNISSAQINAITDTGEEVILFDNGTWKYLNDSSEQKTIIPVNGKEFLKNKNASFLVKSKRLNLGIWIDPKSWSFFSNKENDVSEFQFQKKSDDLYGMFISEKIEIPLETLKSIALQNAKKASSDIKIVKEEYRKVNGIQVLMLQMTGTIQGIKFTYLGYYYSNANGTIQFLTYTSDNLFSTYQKDIEEFLNGLVEI